MKTLVWDTETTGLLQPSIVPLEKQPSIISLYGSMIDDEGNVLESIDLNFNPGFPVEPIITKITGLTNEFLADKPKFSEHEEQIRNFVMSADVTIAHNAKFDCGMLNNELKRCGTFELMVWPRILCTVESTMSIRGHRLNLTALHTHLFGKAFDSAHSAGGDVAALTACVIELRRLGYL